MSRRDKEKTPVTRKDKREAVVSRLKEFPELPDRAIARQLSVSHTFVGKLRYELGLEHRLDAREVYLNHPYIKSHPELLEASERTLRALKAPGVLDLMQERGIGARYAQALLRRAENEEKEKAASELTAMDIVLRCDDLRTGLMWIETASVDAVIVDPPYDRSAVEGGLYKAIATTAARVLKPCSPLVIMTGHAYLDKVFSQLAEVDGLSYLWMLHYVTKAGGGAAYTGMRGAMSFAKPCLVYVKGSSAVWTGKPFSDYIEASTPDKSHKQHHKHQQDVTGFCELVRRFTEPGNVVLDCCMGSGTTGVSCVKLRRKFVGCDIDAESVRVARERIGGALEEQDGGV